MEILKRTLCRKKHLKKRIKLQTRKKKNLKRTGKSRFRSLMWTRKEIASDIATLPATNPATPKLIRLRYSKNVFPESKVCSAISYNDVALLPLPIKWYNNPVASIIWALRIMHPHPVSVVKSEWPSWGKSFRYVNHSNELKCLKKSFVRVFDRKFSGKQKHALLINYKKMDRIVILTIEWINYFARDASAWLIILSCILISNNNFSCSLKKNALVCFSKSSNKTLFSNSCYFDSCMFFSN